MKTANAQLAFNYDMKLCNSAVINYMGFFHNLAYIQWMITHKL